MISPFLKGISLFLKRFYVNICPRFIYTNERNFNDPKKFSVERWLNDADKSKNVIEYIELNDDPMKFIPFSAFGRNCIGQHLAQIEAKIIICETLKAYKVVPSD
jgi:cytochrome P450